MSMLAIFDHHKNTLMENLKAAGDAGQIRQVISDCFDRMLAEHNEALSDPDSNSNRAQLGLAAALVAQAKTSVRFLDSTGEPVVWEKRSSSSSGSGVSNKAGSLHSLSRLSKAGLGTAGAGLLIFWISVSIFPACCSSDGPPGPPYDRIKRTGRLAADQRDPHIRSG